MKLRNMMDFDRRLFSPDDGGSGGGAPPAGNSSPAAATPSASPSPAAPTSPAAEAPSADSGAEFSGMGVDDFDDLEVLPSDVVPPEKAAAAASPEAPKVPAQAAAPAAPQATPAAAAPPAPQAGQQEQQPAQPAASPSPAGPQSLVEAMDANRDALIQAIAQDKFALTKEEAEAIETDFVGNLPKLGARVFYEATRAVHNIVQQLVPQLIEQHLGAVKKREETETAFYGQFKALDKTKHHNDVIQFAKTFKQVNPNATRDELWAMVAASVAAKHGLSLQQANTVVANAANGGSPQRPPATEPFAPARPGVVVRSTPEPESPWGGMGKDFDSDDEG